MGVYIDPPDMTKEEWLSKYATKINYEEIEPYNELKASGMLPVCLIDNSFFTAAGICYSAEEFDVFSSPADHRPKRWFIALIEDLKKVSPQLEDYLAFSKDR